MNCRRLSAVVITLVLLFGLIPTQTVLGVNQDDPWSVHGQDYYGRTALASLPNADALIYAYDQIAAGVEEAQQTIIVYNGTDALSASELSTVFEAYRRDYAQHFWLGSGYSYSFNYGSTDVYSVLPKYILTGNALETARAKFDAAVNEILSGITRSMSEFEKELYIHDRLAERITYTDGTTHAHNSYGAIVEGRAVCEGYAEAFQYLLEREGIHSFIVTGYGYSDGSFGAHEWNYVRIDGKYYHVDLTWNDGKDRGFHGYFNVTDDDILEDHYISSVGFELPVCDSLDANYYAVMGTRLDTYTVESLAQLLKANNYSVYFYIQGDAGEFLNWFVTEKNYKNIAKSAGITTSYKVNYSYLHNEFLISYVMNSSATKVATVENNNKTLWYTSVASAIENVGDGYVKLLADCSEKLTITKDLYIDLNGFDMTGKITVAEGATLYGMDSTTNDYDCTDDYGRITNLSGNYAPHHKSSVTGMPMRYMAIKEDGAVSFHRFFVGIVYMSLQPTVTGVGYKAIFAGDHMVIAQLDEEEAFGYELGLEGGRSIQVYKDRDSFVSGKKVSLRVDNFDIEHFGEQELYAHVMIKLNDGTVIESAEVTMTLRGMLEKLNDDLSILSPDQFNKLMNLIAEHPIIKYWDISNFFK